jgi:hypothetical protein
MSAATKWFRVAAEDANQWEVAAELPLLGRKIKY